MEYTFKNSLADKVCTIKLDQEGLVMHSAGVEDPIPYTLVRSVQLSRMNDQTFMMTIRISGRAPLIVTNKYFYPSGEFEDRSRQYGAFVRIFHYHLKTKATAVFTSGKSARLLLVWVVLAAFVSFLVSFISEYLAISVMNPFGQSVFLTGLIVLVILVLNRGKFPRQYSPEEIPLQFLP